MERSIAVHIWVPFQHGVREGCGRTQPEVAVSLDRMNIFTPDVLCTKCVDGLQAASQRKVERAAVSVQ